MSTFEFKVCSAQISPNALLYVELYNWPPADERDVVSNIEGPWVYDDDDRARLQEYLGKIYIRPEGFNFDPEMLREMFANMVNRSWLYVTLYCKHQDAHRRLLRVCTEDQAYTEVIDELNTQISQPGSTNFYTVRLIKGRNEAVTDANKEAIVRLYIIPKEALYYIGEDRLTSKSKEVALEDAREILQHQLKREGGGDLPATLEFSYSPGNECWMMNPGDRFKWLVTVTKMRVSKLGRTQ